MVTAFNPGLPVSSNPGYAPGSAPAFDGGGFLPNSLSGLQLWLDADSSVTITQSGGKVSQWDDKSGNGNNATQGTGSAQPTFTTGQINNLPSMVFDGAADFMGLGQPASLDFTPGTDPFTIFLVTQTTVANAGTMISKAGSTSSLRQYQLVPISNDMVVIIGGTTGTFLDVVTGSDAKILRLDVDSDANFFINGAADSANPETIGAATNSADVLIGARRNDDINDTVTNFFSGQIGEILVYNRILATAEISLVNGYLSNKWGVTLA